VAKAAKRPEEQAEEDTEQDGGSKRKRERPAFALPGKVSGQAAEGKVEPRKTEDKEARDDKSNAQKDENTSQFGHERAKLGGGQHGSRFAEKLGWLTGFGEDAYRARQLAGLLTNVLQVGVERGEHDDTAGGKLLRDIADKREAVAIWHGDVAEEEVGRKLAGAIERLVRGVGSSGVEATLREDESERVGDQTVIVNDQNSLHDILSFGFGLGFHVGWMLVN
jgi:hypothetical protein